jgi:hypothetical protein
MVKEVLGVKGVNFEAQNFKANGKIIILDKLQLTGQNIDVVFNFRSDCVYVHAFASL